LKKFLFTLAFWGLLTTGADSSAAAQDYYIYNLKGRQILYLKDGADTFAKGPKMTRKPDLVLRTGSGGFLVVLPPETGADNSIPGQLALYNAKGKRIHRIDLGYPPFRWAVTQDRRHFFIAYKSSLTQEGFVLMHYDTEKMTAEKLLNYTQVYDLKLSWDEKLLLSLVKGQEQPQLTVLGYSPWKVRSTLVEHSHPQAIYPLTAETVATVSFDNRSTRELKRQPRAKGSVRLINITANTVLAQAELPVAPVYSRYYWKNNTLLVICGGWHETFFGIGGYGDVFKVTPSGISYFALKTGWTDFTYLPEKDTLYFLALGPFGEDQLSILQLEDATTDHVPTGPNIYQTLASPYKYHFPYSFFHVPDADYLIAACPQNGDIRFFNLSANLLQEAGERQGFRPWWSSPDIFPDPGAIVSANADCTKFYVLNYVHNEIAVYDPALQNSKIIPLKEPILGMYHIRQPKPQTLVAGINHLYRFDQNKESLQRIAKFKNKARRIKLYQDGHRIILRTDQELLVLNLATLKVKQRFILNKGRGQQVRQRYCFLEPVE
jgi:hypothetical protein